MVKVDGLVVWNLPCYRMTGDIREMKFLWISWVILSICIEFGINDRLDRILHILCLACVWTCKINLCVDREKSIQWEFKTEVFMCKRISLVEKDEVELIEGKDNLVI